MAIFSDSVKYETKVQTNAYPPFYKSFRVKFLTDLVKKKKNTQKTIGVTLSYYSCECYSTFIIKSWLNYKF